MKWWENWIKNFKALRRRNTVSSSSGEDDGAEDEGEIIEKKKEDERPGDVKLNGGDYGKVFGLNRKIAMGLMATLLVVVALALLFNIQNRSNRAQKPQQPQRQEEAAALRNGSKEGGYDALFQQNQKNAQGRNGAQGQAQQQADPMARSAAQPQANASQTAAAPAITAPAYTIPAPTARAVQQEAKPAADAKEQEEKARQRSLDERFKSAIAFSLGEYRGSTPSTTENGTSGQGTTDGAVQVQASSASGAAASLRYSAPGDNMLQAGTLIPAMLFTGINTDIAGQATAQVMVDVYDTPTRTNLLIPAGSQLIGSYGEGNSSGNGRVNVTFSTLVLPDGGSYAIDGSMVAVDGAGYNGIAGKVHHHTGKILRQGILNSAMTALSTIAVDRVTLDMSALNSMANTGAKDTVTVEPGREFNLYVTKPLAFSLP